MYSITAAPTAAIPLIERTVTRPEIPNIDKMFPLIAPAEAPINRAGEKIPPKRPKPIQTAVMAILARKRIISDISRKFPTCISDTTVVPSPRISGIKIPTVPQISAAIIKLFEGENPNVFAKLVVFLKDCMYITLIMPNIGPKINAIGRASVED